MDYLKLIGAGAVTASAITTATYLYLTQDADPVLLATDMNDQSLLVRILFIQYTYM